MKIRSLLQIFSQKNHDEAVRDPFCQSRTIREHYLKNCAAVAIPIGVSALDENTIRRKPLRSPRSFINVEQTDQVWNQVLLSSRFGYSILS